MDPKRLQFGTLQPAPLPSPPKKKSLNNPAHNHHPPLKKTHLGRSFLCSKNYCKGLLHSHTHTTDADTTYNFIFFFSCMRTYNKFIKPKITFFPPRFQLTTYYSLLFFFFLGFFSFVRNVLKWWNDDEQLKERGKKIKKELKFVFALLQRCFFFFDLYILLFTLSLSLYCVILFSNYYINDDDLLSSFLFFFFRFFFSYKLPYLLYIHNIYINFWSDVQLFKNKKETVSASFFTVLNLIVLSYYFIISFFFFVLQAARLHRLHRLHLDPHLTLTRILFFIVFLCLCPIFFFFGKTNTKSYNHTDSDASPSWPKTWLEVSGSLPIQRITIYSCHQQIGEF